MSRMLIFYIDRFLFVAFANHRFAAMYSELYFLDTFWRLWKLLFFEEKKIEIILYFLFYPKTSNFHNSGIVSRRKLPDLSLNNIFSVLSIGLQYTLSFKRPKFGVKFSVTIMPKGQSLILISLGGKAVPWYVFFHNLLVTYPSFMKFDDLP